MPGYIITDNESNTDANLMNHNFNTRFNRGLNTPDKNSDRLKQQKQLKHDRLMCIIAEFKNYPNNDSNSLAKFGKSDLSKNFTQGLNIKLGRNLFQCGYSELTNSICSSTHSIYNELSLNPAFNPRPTKPLIQNKSNSISSFHTSENLLNSNLRSEPPLKYEAISKQGSIRNNLNDSNLSLERNFNFDPASAMFKSKKNSQLDLGASDSNSTGFNPKFIETEFLSFYNWIVNYNKFSNSQDSVNSQQMQKINDQKTVSLGLFVPYISRALQIANINYRDTITKLLGMYMDLGTFAIENVYSLYSSHFRQVSKQVVRYNNNQKRNYSTNPTWMQILYDENKLASKSLKTEDREKFNQLSYFYSKWINYYDPLCVIMTDFHTNREPMLVVPPVIDTSKPNHPSSIFKNLQESPVFIHIKYVSEAIKFYNAYCNEFNDNTSSLPNYLNEDSGMTVNSGLQKPAATQDTSTIFLKKQQNYQPGYVMMSLSLICNFIYTLKLEKNLMPETDLKLDAESKLHLEKLIAEFFKTEKISTSSLHSNTLNPDTTSFNKPAVYGKISELIARINDIIASDHLVKLNHSLVIWILLLRGVLWIGKTVDYKLEITRNNSQWLSNMLNLLKNCNHVCHSVKITPDIRAAVVFCLGSGWFQRFSSSLSLRN